MTEPNQETVLHIRRLLSDKLDRIQEAMGWNVECNAIRDEISIPRSLAFKLIDVICDEDDAADQKRAAQQLADLMPQIPPSISGERP